MSRSLADTASILVLAGGVAAAAWLAVAGRSWVARRRVAAWVLWLAAVAAGILLTAGAYAARKTLALCLMPLGLVWIALFVLALERLARGRTRAAAAAGLLWLAVGAAGSPAAGVALTAWLERPFAAVDPLRTGPFDAVLVLGGGVGLGPGDRVIVTEAGDRAVLAARLWRAGATRILVATGPVKLRPDRPPARYGDVERRLWVELGVSREAVVALNGPRTTSEEVRAFARLVRERGWRRIAVLSSAWHLRRARRLCARAGLEAAMLPADFLGIADVRDVRAVVPQEEGLARTQHAAWEILGMLAGR